MIFLSTCRSARSRWSLSSRVLRWRRTRSCCRARRQSGNELAEFALTLPFFAMLLLVVGQVAGAVQTHSILTNAVREGARLAVVPGEYGQTAEVQNRVLDYAAANGITLAAASVTVDQNEMVSQGGGGCDAASPCIKASKVSVTYDYPLSLLLGHTLHLGAAVEMRNFY